MSVSQFEARNRCPRCGIRFCLDQLRKLTSRYTVQDGNWKISLTAFRQSRTDRRLTEEYTKIQFNCQEELTRLIQELVSARSKRQ